MKISNILLAIISQYHPLTETTHYKITTTGTERKVTSHNFWIQKLSVLGTYGHTHLIFKISVVDYWSVLAFSQHCEHLFHEVFHVMKNGTMQWSAITTNKALPYICDIFYQHISDSFRNTTLPTNNLFTTKNKHKVRHALMIECLSPVG